MIKIELIDNKRVVEIWVEGKLLKKVDKKLYSRYLSKIRACQTEEELKDLLTALDDKIALGYVYKLLSLRGYLEGELRKKLRLKKIGEKAIDGILEKCRKAGYLDDQRETQLIIEREKRRGQGPLIIKRKLKEKGGIEIQAGDHYSDDEQRKQIQQLIAKRFPDLSDIKTKQRAFRFFARRGFSEHLIREIVLE